MSMSPDSKEDTENNITLSNGSIKTSTEILYGLAAG